MILTSDGQKSEQRKKYEGRRTVDIGLQLITSITLSAQVF